MTVAVRFAFVVALVVALGSTGCTSNCDNAGVSVDGNGNIVVRGETGFISPNSSVLKNVTNWPQPPNGEENFAFSQGYALSRDGSSLYLLANTAAHPNLVYRIDLATGLASLVGRDPKGEHATGSALGASSAGAASKETWIASDGRYIYSVDQQQPAISRARATEATRLAPFISGSKTRLHGPIGVAVDRNGRLCALNSETSYVLCFAPSASGNVAPAQAIDTSKLLGYGQVGAIAFGRPGQLVVAGTGDRNGLRGLSLATIDVGGSTPRLLKTIGGPATKLGFLQSIAVDRLGNILVLQRDSLAFNSGAQLLAFRPEQRGNVAPSSIRDPATSGSHSFRMAIDEASGDVAILGSDGIAYFPASAGIAPDKWPAETHLPFRGWDVAFGDRSLIVADEFGVPTVHALSDALKESPIRRSSVLDLHDPEFISTDQAGRVYVASTDGVITALPSSASRPAETLTISFRTPFGRNMSAFAVDSAGYYYISSTSNNAIVVVGPNARQSTISGGSTGLNHPIGLAVSHDGTLFVANSDGRNVLEFGRGSHGDVPPIGRIEGASTGLVAPQALAIDSGGKLYVFDGPITAVGSGAAHFVRVYDAGKRGDIAPLESHPVQTKCWVNAP